MQLQNTQDEILARASGLVAPGGRLVYATCSVLTDENEDRVAAFLNNHGNWRLDFKKRWPIAERGDGFFLAQLARISEFEAQP